MRAGAITVQQTLTTEAASVLKHSLSLARRRGHAQVTPLHVAATLLSSRASLLRRACLKSQSAQTTTQHHHHSRALELCFNVALNRLPTTPGPLLHGQPSLSNALVAALKRAQAHQRRGCIEQQQHQQLQQQPLLAIKVELEQLILSILDDPSVSRVMREAGFCSTLVKNNLEESAFSASPVFQYCYNSSTSGGVYSSPCSPTSATDVINNFPSNFWHAQLFNYPSEQNPLFLSPQKRVKDSDSVNQEDIKLVFEILLRKKRKNTVIVGDSVSMTEGLVIEIMGKIERGDVPNELKSAHFIRFQFSSVPLRFMKKEEVEVNLSDLKRKVDNILSLGGGRGVIIFTGDLKWTVEHGNHRDDKYSPVDHLVAEIGRLICEYNNGSSKVWLMATANYQTHMKCQMKQPSLEIQWALQAVSVPSGGLGLSLNATSVHDSKMAFSSSSSQVLGKLLTSKDQDGFTCCAECTTNYEKEAALFKSDQQQNKPSWLLSQSSESLQRDNLAELRRKWSRLCHSLHQGRLQNHMDSSLLHNQRLIAKNYSYTSTNPWWPNQNIISLDTNSISFADSVTKPNRINASTVPRFRRQQSCHIEFNYSDRNQNHQVEEPNLNSLKSGEEKDVKTTLALGNLLPSEGERKSQEFGDICKMLQENVPWQSEKISSIVQVLMENSKSVKKESSWILLHGNDSIGKRRLALGISEAVLGSADHLFCMNMRNAENKMRNCSEMLERAMRNREKLVVLVEDVDFADAQFIKFLSEGFGTGKFGDHTCNKECGSETIFVLTKGDPKRYLDNGKDIKPPVIQMKLKINGTSPGFDQKRKSEIEIFHKCKSARINEKEVKHLMTTENGNSKKQLSRQSSFNTLDLNIMADDQDEEDNDTLELEHSPISSDVTLEITNDLQSPLGFLESIKNQFVFNQEDRKMRDIFLSKIKGSFEENKIKNKYGSDELLYVEEEVLTEMVTGCGSFLENMFDKWLKDIFQTSLDAIKFSIGNGEGRGVIRLCLGDKKENGIQVTGIQEGNGILENGFMGSNLPKKIHF